MDNIIQESPKVFISYSWDGDEIKKWVKKLATDLRDNGIDAKLDQWEVVPGDQMPYFMERSVRENNFVLVICSHMYKTKSENRIGGVGYEGDIMTNEVSRKANHRKFIPLLYEGDDNSSIPNWLQGSFYINFTDNSTYELTLEYLLKTLLGKLEMAPPLGAIPERFVETFQRVEEKMLEQEDENIPMISVVEEERTKEALSKPEKNPFLEAELIWHGSSRSPRGYSSKNPTEVDENGLLVTVIGLGQKPIIFWDLTWRFELKIHNNSSYSAINIKIDYLSQIRFSELQRLETVNHIKPFESLTLNAQYRKSIEDIHTVADEMLSNKIPQELEGFEMKISYLDEGRTEHVTNVQIIDNQLINRKED